MNEKQLKLNQSVEKAFLIIEIMAREKTGMRLQDISKLAEIPPATTLRILYTLMTLGYATQDEKTALYSLTLRFSYVGSQIESQLDIRTLIKPYLIEIAKECGEAACLSIKDFNELVYIDTVDSRDSILIATQRIGKRAPLYCTGAGKLYLADFSDKELKSYVNQQPLNELTPHTITTMSKLNEELDTIRNRGFALDNEECELGVKCVAVPIRNYKGTIVATASVSGPISRMTADRINMIHSKLSTYMQLVENSLAYSEQVK